MDLDDLDAAEPLLRSVSNDPVAMYELSLLSRRRGQRAEAERWLRLAADAGHADAADELGVPAGRSQSAVQVLAC
jgi:hypothetical protein